MMTGVTIGEYHSYDDLKMLLATREIGVPTVQTNTVEVPGRNGLLDLTEVLYGVKYYNRTLTLTFLTTTNLTGVEWSEFLSDIAAKFHGQKLKIIFDEDPDWYYYGRVSINSFVTDCYKQTVTLECDCEPYKYAVNETEITLTVADEEEVALENDEMEAVPTIDTDDDITIICGTTSVSLSSGTYEVPGLTIASGSTTWTVTYIGESTSASVTITYRQGRL